MRKSFTLIEILIGLAIFIFLLIALQNFIAGLFSSSFRALAMKRLADNTRTALEIMGREMRLAANPGAAGDASCNLGPGESFLVTAGARDITFLTFPAVPGGSSDCIMYRFDTTDKVVYKRVNGSVQQAFLGISSGAVRVENFSFTLDPNPIPFPANKQPRVTINARVSTNDPTSPTKRLNIELQTTISQREI